MQFGTFLNGRSRHGSTMPQVLIDASLTVVYLLGVLSQSQSQGLAVSGEASGALVHGHAENMSAKIV